MIRRGLQRVRATANHDRRAPNAYALYRVSAPGVHNPQAPIWLLTWRERVFSNARMFSKSASDMSLHGLALTRQKSEVS